jgi:flavin-dependent dehydrogenase
MNTHFDIAIIGGGLAGLTLALQLKQKSPEIEIVILERNQLPVPMAAHKVGESTVEIGAHYLSQTLGLEQLLETTQLRKFGFRLFFGSGNHDDLAKADELGASNFLPVTSYQLDRGRLENDLADMLKGMGVSLMDGCMVEKASIGSNGNVHTLRFKQDGQTHSIRCNWVVDAASRFALLKRQLDLAQSSKHNVNAAWFRLDAPIAVDDWSNSQAWSDRCNGLRRRFSTNHLMGRGYWAWIIPLVGDRTSIGLVADPEIHSFSSFNDFDKLSEWLAVHEPQLAETVSKSSSTLMDFKRLKKLSHDCKQVWSNDGWALTGESGVFADPFYSPGTDFIAISNTFICDLITRKKSEWGQHIYAGVYQKMYRSFFESTMSLYENQYPGFGDTRLMVLKLTWDYAFYWSVLAWLYFRNLMTDISFIRMVEPQLAAIRSLNESMQLAFRQRSAERRSDMGQGRFFDQVEIPVLANLNAALITPAANLKQEFDENCTRLDALAPLLLDILNNPDAGGNRECSLLGDLRSRFK